MRSGRHCRGCESATAPNSTSRGGNRQTHRTGDTRPKNPPVKEPAARDPHRRPTHAILFVLFFCCVARTSQSTRPTAPSPRPSRGRPKAFGRPGRSEGRLRDGRVGVQTSACARFRAAGKRASKRRGQEHAHSPRCHTQRVWWFCQHTVSQSSVVAWFTVHRLWSAGTPAT